MHTDIPSTEAFLAFYEEGLDKPDYPSEEKIQELANSRALRAYPRADVLLEVPYIHQLWDTPPAFHGTWACGPTSVAMVLAYYGLLKPDPIEVPQPSPHESPFGRYVAEPFEHNGHLFGATAPTKRGRGAGLYGACVNANGDGSMFAPPMGMLNVLNHFLEEVGNRARFYQGKKLTSGPEVDEKPRRKGRTMVRGDTETLFKTSIDQGHPVITSCDIYRPGKTKPYGHFLVVRGYYFDDARQERMWIVNDPYGFVVSSEFDGEAVVYEYFDMNPKYAALLEGPFIPQQEAIDKAVRLFSPSTNQQVGTGTLVGGTDKVYIKTLDKDAVSGATRNLDDNESIRLFDKDNNEPVGEGTLVAGTDKVYIKRLALSG